MGSRRQSWFGGVVAVSVAALTLGTGAVGAGASGADPAALPAGYVTVASADIAVPAGVQTHGEVSCPTGTKPVGGGVYTGSTSLLVNVNSSHEKGTRNWAVDMNNASAGATTMKVYAACMKRPARKFTVNTATFNNPAGTQSVGAVACPSGVVVGGGVVSSSFDLGVNISTLYPANTTTYTAWMNNASASAATFTVTAICRTKKPGGYARVEGTVQSNPAGTQTTSTASCAPTAVPLSGGVYSSGSGLHQSMVTSTPFGTGWSNHFNNGDGTPNTTKTVIICAGT